jgi:hypothetical protein
MDNKHTIRIQTQQIHLPRDILGPKNIGHGREERPQSNTHTPRLGKGFRQDRPRENDASNQEIRSPGTYNSHNRKHIQRTEVCRKDDTGRVPRTKLKSGIR